MSSLPTRASLTDAVVNATAPEVAAADSAESELQSEVFVEQVPLRVKVANILAMLIPLAGLIAAAALTWGWGFSWVHLGLMVGMYLVSILGVTIGYHRLFTHKSFATTRTMKVILAICGSMAVEGPVVKWVAMHRRHHTKSDKEGDPHSPHLHGETFGEMVKGFWHAHIGWMFRPDAPDIMDGVKDLLEDKSIRWVDSLFSVWVTIGLFLPAALGWAITGSWKGALLGFLWGGLVRVFLVHHVTFCTNSLCHIWGSRPYRSNDQSTNNAIIGILGVGEGWHNNHHAFPTSARHGLRWWQFDLTWICIKVMSWVGLVWDIRLPSAEALAMKSTKKAAATA